MTSLIDCPRCALPATIRSQGEWPGTGGPVEHMHLRCVAGHRFFGPTDILSGRRGRRHPDR